MGVDEREKRLKGGLQRAHWNPQLMRHCRHLVLCLQVLSSLLNISLPRHSLMNFKARVLQVDSRDISRLNGAPSDFDFDELVVKGVFEAGCIMLLKCDQIQAVLNFADGLDLGLLDVRFSETIRHF